VVTSRYDAGGRLVERDDATGTTAYAYNRLNRLVEERLPGSRTNAYSYDGVGNLTSVTDAPRTVSYGYDAVKLATSVVGPADTPPPSPTTTTTTAPQRPSERRHSAGRLTRPPIASPSIEGTKGTSVLTRSGALLGGAGAGLNCAFNNLFESF
jgi:YD repeat-containing protein